MTRVRCNPPTFRAGLSARGRNYVGACTLVAGSSSGLLFRSLAIQRPDRPPFNLETVCVSHFGARRFVKRPQLLSVCTFPFLFFFFFLFFSSSGEGGGRRQVRGVLSFENNVISDLFNSEAITLLITLKSENIFPDVGERSRRDDV